MGSVASGLAKGVGGALGFGGGKSGGVNVPDYQFDPNLFKYRQADYNPQAADVNYDPQNEFRTDQRTLIQALQAKAAGTAPSVAEQTLRTGQDTAFRQALAQAASQRGGNVGLAQRSAFQNAANLQGQLAGQGALARLQEQEQAQNSLGQALMQGRQQDLGVAGLQQQRNLANLLAQQQNAESQLNAGMGLEQTRSGFAANRNAQIAEGQRAAAQRRQSFVGGLINAGAGIAAKAFLPGDLLDTAKEFTGGGGSGGGFNLGNYKFN